MKMVLCLWFMVFGIQNGFAGLPDMDVVRQDISRIKEELNDSGISGYNDHATFPKHLFAFSASTHPKRIRIQQNLDFRISFNFKEAGEIEGESSTENLKLKAPLPVNLSFTPLERIACIGQRDTVAH